MQKPALITAALLSGCFALAVTIEPNLASSRPYARHERAPVDVIFGEARRLFAYHFFVKADVYFHSGYYPSIFDQPAGHRNAHIATGAGAAEHTDHEEGTDFLGKPLDCLDKLSRSFFPSHHTHLDEEPDDSCPDGHHEHDSHKEGHENHGSAGKVREMLPWLRMAASLDPNRIETYTVGAYWLRTRMKKADQAEEFLREGLEANPGSYAILFELGRNISENSRDARRAKNLWETALQRWNEEERDKPDPDTFLFLQITWHLALAEEEAGNLEKALSYFEMTKSASPSPDHLQKRIDEVRAAAAQRRRQ